MAAANWKALMGMSDDAVIAANRMINSQSGQTTLLGKPIQHSGKPASKNQQGGPSGAPDTVDPTMAVVNKLDAVSSKAMMAGFVGSGVLTAGASLANWTSKKTGATALEKLGGGMERVNGATMADIGGRVPILGSVVSAGSRVMMGGVAMVTDLLHAIGFTDVMANRHTGKFLKHQEALAAHSEKLFSATYAHPEVQQAMTALEKTVSVHPSKFDAKAYGEAIAAVKEKATAHAPALHKDLRPFEKALGNANNSYALADGWGNLSKYTREAPGKMAKVGAMHGVMNAGILVGTGVSTFRTGHDLHKSLTNLRSMYAELTHQRPEDVSGMRLLFGKVPGTVAAARAQLFKEFGPAVVLDGANTVLNVSWVVRNRGSMLLLIAAGLGSQLLRGVLAGDILPMYGHIKEAQQRHEQVSAEDYAKLVGEASKELRERGGPGSNFALALGEMYASEQAKVGDVLREVESGAIHKRIAKLQAEQNAAQAASAKEHKAETSAHAPEVSHVDRLQHKAAGSDHPKKHDHKVLGKHTEKLHKTTQDVSTQHGIPGAI